MSQRAGDQKICFEAFSWLTAGALALLVVSMRVSPGFAQTVEPDAEVTKQADTNLCPGFPGKRNLAVVGIVQRSQYLLANNIPSDVMLRCGGRTVNVGLRQDGLSEQVKTASFTAETNMDVRTMEASVFGGSGSVRYGLYFENIVNETSSELRLAGATSGKETVSGTAQSARIEAGTLFGPMATGVSVKYVSAKFERGTPVAGTTVATSGKRLDLIQPGFSLAWQKNQTHVMALRNQSAQDSTDQDQLKLPWTNAVRVVQLLEEDQGIRAQLERSGQTDPDRTATNAGLIAYFMSIDNVTVDMGWFGRSASYSVKEEATADQLATFGIGASTIWHYSPAADVYAALHSLSANDALGGKEKRTAHRLITGGNLGIQVAF